MNGPYTLAMREAHAEQVVLWAAAGGWLEATISREIVRTYGRPESFVKNVKAMKAKFRNELSFGGDGK